MRLALILPLCLALVWCDSSEDATSQSSTIPAPRNSEVDNEGTNAELLSTLLAETLPDWNRAFEGDVGFDLAPERRVELFFGRPQELSDVVRHFGAAIEERRTGWGARILTFGVEQEVIFGHRAPLLTFQIKTRSKDVALLTIESH